MFNCKGFAIPAVNAVSSCGINACMEAAAKFGPEQKDAANDWIKMVVLGTDAGKVTAGFRESLLAQKITLFGECLGRTTLTAFHEKHGYAWVEPEASGKKATAAAGARWGVARPRRTGPL